MALMPHPAQGPEVASDLKWIVLRKIEIQLFYRTSTPRFSHVFFKTTKNPMSEPSELQGFNGGIFLDCDPKRLLFLRGWVN